MEPSKFPITRRTLLKELGIAPIALRAADLWGASPPSDPLVNLSGVEFFPADVPWTPHYPEGSPLADVLRHVEPGLDGYIFEKYALEIHACLRKIGDGFISSLHNLAAIEPFLDDSIVANTLTIFSEKPVRSGQGLDIVRRHFTSSMLQGRNACLDNFRQWLAPVSAVETAEFEIVALEEISQAPQAMRSELRYDLVSRRNDGKREERVGSWRMEWSRDPAGSWTARRLEADKETVSVADQPAFVDITDHAMSGVTSYSEQLLHGADYWRTVLDGACGIDVYGNNGIAAGDYNNDGFDDLYISQPAGLPNRLYRNRGDGTFEDVTQEAGVGVLDGTACALFADFDNRGLQDLLIVCASGPLLYRNQGNGTFAFHKDAFRFAQEPEGAFTHAALADYDGDGKLDIYLCTYSYYVGLDQYHYPVPYCDARNGPANYLMQNQGNGTFVDHTQASGLHVDNNRYSFSCAWSNLSGSKFPDLYVANDFGRSNLYKNRGDGTFEVISSTAKVDDPGAGMSASWADIDLDGKQDVYVANMWSAAGVRVSAQKQFQEYASEETRSYYRHHARGNSLYRNQGNGTFQNVAPTSGAEMGRWSWSSDFWDFDHDGYPDIYIANGYISAQNENGPDRTDLSSFFWRQVVAKSPLDATPSMPYEKGWNALNELIRSDRSWSGYERNVLLANNRDGTFSEVSGALSMDFLEDSRSFALADLDGDGKLEVILKNRNAPQIRILQNRIKAIGNSISFRLRGTQSNRDAIGASVTVETPSNTQTKFVQAGSGFLAQHSKELFFGVGDYHGTLRVEVRWPAGLTQHFDNLPMGHRIDIAEGEHTYLAKPFSPSVSTSRISEMTDVRETLPSHSTTWLLEPLQSPDFSLPNTAVGAHKLQDFLGTFLLLYFWSSKVPNSIDNMRQIDNTCSHFSSLPLKLLFLTLDSPEEMDRVRSLSASQPLTSLIALATDELSGTYNLISRYLFDRRKDMSIPSAFLLDPQSRIIKVYQGAIDPSTLRDDVLTAPADAAQRLRRALPFAGISHRSGSQRNDFTYGVAMLQHGYLKQAERAFQQVVSVKPDDAEAYYNLGTLKLKSRDFEDSQTYLKRALQLKPNYPEAWNNLGMIAAQTGNADRAIASFTQALSLRPGFPIALLNLGNLYRRQKDFTKAQDTLSEALHRQPDDPDILYSLGMLCAQQNLLEQASQYLHTALVFRPDNPEALNNLGVLYVRQNEYDKAKEQFERCIQSAPTFDQSYINLARIYVMRNDKSKAISVLNTLLRIVPDNMLAKQTLEVLR